MSIQTGEKNPSIEPLINTDGIEYCLIAIGPQILIEYNDMGNYLDTGYIISARRLPQQLCNMEYGTLKTYNYEGYSYHCKVSDCRDYTDRIVFLALAKTAYSPQTVFSFLREVESLFIEFLHSYEERGEKPEFERFMATLKDRVVYYSGDPTSIKIRQIRQDAAEVKDIMVQNIDDIAKRGESLQNIADKTGMLTMKSKEFRSASKKLKRTMWWQSTKFWVFLAVFIVVIILATIIGLTLGGVIPPIWKWFGGGGGHGGDDSDTQNFEQ